MYGYSLTLVFILTLTIGRVWSVQHAGKDKIKDNTHLTIRRQQVIHPLDEDKTTSKNDDDIEQYGKTLDASGALITKPAQKSVTGNTKDIIAKIKEIQDKIFKRTNGNNKILEDELRLMSPNLPARKTTDVNGDRRKIIPEDVVDKILQKFQQLRSEAKNLALASASDPESKAKATTVSAIAKDKATDATTTTTEPVNPYASIEPPKESIELINRTHNDDVTSIGVSPPMESHSGENRDVPSQPGEKPGQPLTDPNTGDIQIPIGNSASDANSAPPTIGGKSAPGVPIMFVKHGPNLIPVYNEPPNLGARGGPAPPASVANEAAVQYNTGQPPQPNMPGKIIPMMTNLAPESSTFYNGPDEERQDVRYDSAPDTRSTGQLIDKLIHTPGFPQLASKLMSEGRVNYDEQPRWQTPTSGDSRNFVPMSDRNVEGLNPAVVNFNMKNTYTNNLPDQPSMLQDDGRTDFSKDVERFLDKQPRQKPDMTENNFPQHNVEGYKQHDGRFINDISDPIDDFESRYKTKSADELLDYAKFKSMVSPDSNVPPGSQVGMQPPSERDVEARQRNEYFGEQRDRVSREDKKYDRYMNEDPSLLLDELHKSQLHGDLMNAESAPDNSIRPEEQFDEDGHERHRIPSEPAPDDLMDRLVNFNHRMQERQLQHRRELQFNSRHINQGFGQMDPSFADEIKGDNGLMQQFDVERKDVAADNDVQLLKSRSPGLPYNRHGPISVMSGDSVQFKTGQISMDSNDIINSFRKESSYSRNKIGRPRFHRKHKRRFLHPYTRGIIEKPMPLNNDVELRVNGRPLTDNIQLRSSIIDGKVKPGKGKTLVSKEPVQIELSHGENKRKIINIVTKGKYNVINEKKRHKIPHQQNNNLNRLNSL